MILYLCHVSGQETYLIHSLCSLCPTFKEIDFLAYNQYIYRETAHKVSLKMLSDIDYGVKRKFQLCCFKFFENSAVELDWWAFPTSFMPNVSEVYFWKFLYIFPEEVHKVIFQVMRSFCFLSLMQTADRLEKWPKQISGIDPNKKKETLTKKHKIKINKWKDFLTLSTQLSLNIFEVLFLITLVY